ncbi:Drebrin-like protein A [Trichoplax sp. H2]|nr:Drebrin-like protein A [Trichoplax sp. H2]|eukprot:RDD41243.1 Drebrin-like protein A [Trichoplax sp. H2]
MSIDLNTNKKQLLDAWKAVCDNENGVNWALFGYEGKSHVLKVVETSDGDLQDLIEELNGSKIMYAFCRVIDPNTKLPKFVLINWSGDGVPTTVRGTCSNHVRYVTEFFRGAHLVINARSEDDVDPDSVIDKVSKSSGSNYSFHKESHKPVAPIEPVGTNYQPARVTLNQDINIQKRDHFWQKIQDEEKQRSKNEEANAASKRAQYEKEIKEREAREALEREKRLQEKQRAIGRPVDRTMPLRAEAAKLSQLGKEFHQREMQQAASGKRNVTPSLRDEATKLISSSASKPSSDQEVITSTAESKAEEAARLIRAGRAFHEQDQQALQTSKATESSLRDEATALIKRGIAERHSQDHGQVRVRSESKAEEAARLVRAGRTFHDQEEVERHHEASTNRTNRMNDAEILIQQSRQQQREEVLSEQSNQPSEPDRVAEAAALVRQSKQERTFEQTTATSQHYVEESYQQPEPVQQQVTIPDQTTKDEQYRQDNYQEPAVVQYENTSYPATDDQQQEANSAEQSSPPLSGVHAKALYDYQADAADEISFQPGDIIYDIEMIDEGWWIGYTSNSDKGMFPANYVELIES